MLFTRSSRPMRVSYIVLCVCRIIINGARAINVFHRLKNLLNDFRYEFRVRIYRRLKKKFSEIYSIKYMSEKVLHISRVYIND